MLDMRQVVQDPEATQKNCSQRGVKVDVSALVTAYQEKNALQQEIDALRQKQNEIAQKIPKEKDAAVRSTLIEEGRSLKAEISKREGACVEAEKHLLSLMQQIPNRTHPEVPIGGEADSKELKRVGTPRSLSFRPLNHLELGQKLNLVDFDAGTEVAGQKFYFLKNEAVFLELGLIRYVLDILVKRGFTPTITPDLAKTEILEGIGFSPRGEESQIYTIANHDLCLIGTAEITIGGMLKDKILSKETFPMKIAGLSHCFRTEAGASGKESRGLYRVHQFTKLEMFIFCLPEQSDALHDELLAIEEEIFQGLELPYRVLDIASGDLGAPAYRKFDIEAWMPGRGEKGDYGEVTSTSNCTDFQSRRLGIRYRDDKGKTAYVHTLNGTAIALSRALVALLENGQQEDGSIVLPKALVPYCGFERIQAKS